MKPPMTISRSTIGIRWKIAPTPDPRHRIQNPPIMYWPGGMTATGIEELQRETLGQDYQRIHTAEGYTLCWWDRPSPNYFGEINII